MKTITVSCEISDPNRVDEHPGLLQCDAVLMD